MIKAVLFHKDFLIKIFGDLKSAQHVVRRLFVNHKSQNFYFDIILMEKMIAIKFTIPGAGCRIFNQKPIFTFVFFVPDKVHAVVILRGFVVKAEFTRILIDMACRNIKTWDDTDIRPTPFARFGNIAHDDNRITILDGRFDSRIKIIQRHIIILLGFPPIVRHIKRGIYPVKYTLTFTERLSPVSNAAAIAV